MQTIIHVEWDNYIRWPTGNKFAIVDLTVYLTLVDSISHYPQSSLAGHASSSSQLLSQPTLRALSRSRSFFPAANLRKLWNLCLVRCLFWGDKIQLHRVKGYIEYGRFRLISMCLVSFSESKAGAWSLWDSYEAYKTLDLTCSIIILTIKSAGPPSRCRWNYRKWAVVTSCAL